MDIFNHINALVKAMVLIMVVLWNLYIAYYVYGIVTDVTIGGIGAGPSVSVGSPINVNKGILQHGVIDTAATGIDITRNLAKPQDQPAAMTAFAGSAEEAETPTRILHIVTALAEYNNGRRKTVRGEDRLQKVFIPVLQNSVQSMLDHPGNYQVDVYLVLGWKLLPERRKLIEDALPEGVGLQVWDDATPLGYDRPRSDVKMKPVTRALARQHRFVIKDKLMHYDLFSVFEDDMRVTGGHVHHFLELSKELERLADAAPENLSAELRTPHQKQKFHGQLSKRQLKRMIPGFIRVEVLLDEAKHPSQRKLDPIPVDLEFEVEGGVEEKMFDPVPCCHVPEGLGKMPPTPRGDQIMIWETAVKGTVVREMPSGGTGLLDWVMLQPGPKAYGKDFIGGYWSGRGGDYGKDEKPNISDPKFIAQQGGWMATREQLIEMHLHQCTGDFFPPYDKKFNQDGLTLNNVEFWSGGFNIFSGSKGACSMQRVISLKPEHFSQHFLYHTANNKQRDVPNFRLVKANNFMGQVNYVTKEAKKDLRESDAWDTSA